MNIKKLTESIWKNSEEGLTILHIHFMANKTHNNLTELICSMCNTMGKFPMLCSSPMRADTDEFSKMKGQCDRPALSPGNIVTSSVG